MGVCNEVPARSTIPAGELDRLIAKLENATGPDRELDLEIAAALDIPVKIAGPGWDCDLVTPAHPGWRPFPRYTASIDGALGLTEGKLSGRTWSLLNRALHRVSSARNRIVSDVPPFEIVRALLIEILRALQSPAPNDGEREPSRSASPTHHGGNEK